MCSDIIELSGTYRSEAASGNKLYQFQNDGIYIEIEIIANYQGIYREYYKSKKLKRELTFISSDDSNNFLADGEERIYYEGGDSYGGVTYTMLHKNQYHKGERVGIWKTYSTDGGILERFIMKMVVLEICMLNITRNWIE